ncbi:unnamed protein product [Euphydryas editha]|uniref:DUF4817 domain-containing protein n=1 Tax=Euphydryas editha TaxID=104508 RepID=A0AAU9VDZ8_EUPED|nr:unnamed protein product [Euphydryas editha]
MEKYPGTHRTFCVRAYYRNGDSIVASQRLYRAKYRTQHAPSDDSIRKWIRMFENTGATVKIQYWLLSFSPRRRNDSRSGRKDLHLKAYKIHLGQVLKDTDYANRLNFANEMLRQLNNFDNILFSDEANFHLNGHVNKQNCRYWVEENPRRKHARPLHSPKVVVWAAMSARGIIGPFFHEDRTRPTTQCE